MSQRLAGACRFLVVALAIALPEQVGHAETSAADVERQAQLLAERLDAALESSLDRVVTVRLQSGAEMADATLVRIERDSRTGVVRRFRLKLDTGKTRTVSVSSLATLSRDGKELYSAPAAASAGRAPRKRMSRAERRAAAEAEEERLKEEERQKWLTRLRARGVRPWPEMTDADYEAATAKSRKLVEEVQAAAPTMRLFETDNFLFCTNIPQQQVMPFVRSLDKMHVWMCETYGLEKDAKVWLGKAPVFAFLAKEQFLAFERQYFQVNPVGAYGLCHQKSNGEVVIACYRGQDPSDFGQMLVHETSHGFMHRYKTLARLPSWVNEGMADYIGATMVPASTAVERKEKAFIQQMQTLARSGRAPTLGGDFFALEKNIGGHQYGPASAMTRFLLETNAKAYVRFIELMKEGVPFEEALDKTYQATPVELVTAFGKWAGIPGLQS